MNSSKAENKSQLWDYIVEHKQTNPHFLRVAKDHIARLLEYTTKGKAIGPDTFKTEEEYKDFAVSKFFLDKGLQSLKKVSNPEAEEGEIGSDDEDSRESSPLVIFPLTKLEQTKQRFAFWDNSTVGDIFVAKVVAVGKKIYELILLNKDDDDIRTINVFSVSAFMMKESIKETLEVDDLVRVYLLGHFKRDDVIKFKVTANPSETEGLENKKLGKISISEIVRHSNEDSNIRWEQVYRHEVMDKNYQNTFDVMSLLGIDPYKPYCFLPDVKGSSSKINRAANKSDVSATKEKAISKLKVAIQFKEDLGEHKIAKQYATEAIQINPDYDEAYAIRGSITIKHTEDQNIDTIMEGVADCMKSLDLNPYNETARKELSSVLVQCAVSLSKDEASYGYAKDYVEKALEFYETTEAKALHKTLQELMNVIE